MARNIGIYGESFTAQDQTSSKWFKVQIVLMFTKRQALIIKEQRIHLGLGFLAKA